MLGETDRQIKQFTVLYLFLLKTPFFNVFILTWWKCPKEKMELQKNKKVIRLVLPPSLSASLPLVLVLFITLVLA